MAPLPIPAATRRFAFANNGMTTTEAPATMMPGMLRSDGLCRIRVEPDSYNRYTASAIKHPPTIRRVVPSTCSRRDGFRSWWSRHNKAAPDATSITLSKPKPTRETDPDINPAIIEAEPSRLLYPIVKYSRRRPRRTSCCQFSVVVGATRPLSPIGAHDLTRCSHRSGSSAHHRLLWAG